MPSEYELQGTKFIESNGLTFRATPYPEDMQTVPKWHDGQKPIKTKAGPMTHGIRYRITISRAGKPGRLAFDFWGSIKDREAIEIGRGSAGYSANYKELKAAQEARPTPYDVLACISSDASCPDTFADFCGDYGYEIDSRKAMRTFKAVRKLSRKINAFFTPEEIEQLREIQ